MESHSKVHQAVSLLPTLVAELSFLTLVFQEIRFQVRPILDHPKSREPLHRSPYQTRKRMNFGSTLFWGILIFFHFSDCTDRASIFRSIIFMKKSHWTEPLQTPLSHTALLSPLVLAPHVFLHGLRNLLGAEAAVPEVQHGQPPVVLLLPRAQWRTFVTWKHEVVTLSQGHDI